MPKAINNGKRASERKTESKKPNNNGGGIDLKSFSIQQLYSMASQAYAKHKSMKNDSRWNQLIARGGTKKDKIAAISSMIVENPESCLQHLELLVKWCFDQNASFALVSCQALTNIYIDHIFEEKPSLKIFVDSVQDYIHDNKKNFVVGSAELIGFLLQHKFKQFYAEFIRALQLLLQKNISYAKKGAIKALVRLTKHQQLRRNIIAVLINKFGESDKQIVNQVSNALKNEFYQDLSSSEILLEEAEALLFRKNLATSTQFYVINFLNSLNLKFLNESSMNKLFEIFYFFFNKMIDTDTDQSYSSRLFLNSVKGLNKIMSFIKGGSKATRNMIESKTESIYRIAHTTTNSKAKVQLLLFLFQTHSHLTGTLPDRYYRLLYDFIASNQILHCSLTEVFFDLLLISVKQDQNLIRVAAFLKRVLQLCIQASSNFIVTCLIMISKVIQEKQPLKIALSRSQNWLQQKIEYAESEQNRQADKYDMFKREPLYCGAQKTCLWEIGALVNHYHPTVRKYAQCIINNKRVQYEGNNPLLEYNLTSFIQKFGLRKQKKSEAWKIKMKKNLPKIRSSKYQSMLQKPLDSFRQDEQFIKKYIEKRQKIHKNDLKRKQATDIEEFADEFMDRQIDRLHPADALDDLSMSRQSSLDEQENEFEFADEEKDGQAGSEEEGEQEQNEFQGQFDQQGFDQQDLEGYDDMSPGDDDEEESQMESADREFEDAFDEMGQQSEEYPRKKKKINKLSNNNPLKNGKKGGSKKGKFKPNFKPNKNKGRKH